MFENLTGRLGETLRQLRGQSRLTDDNIKNALRDVRMALLEADVALPVVKAFIDRIKEQAVGQDVLKSLSPGQALIKVVHDELVHVMGDVNEDLKLGVQPPAVVLMAGLQGSGKTTTVGKLARFLRERRKKNVLVVSCDIYRPAAIAQLEMLAKEVGAEFFPSNADQDPVRIAQSAVEHGRLRLCDVVIIDTAGRLHVDAQLMDEIKSVHAAVKPHETLFVVDAMTGQDAANTAQAFNTVLPLTGVILTKADGDARGGAALSIRHLTGKPIKFLGMGEKSTALEPFHPDRMASRILGMGDILSLVEQAERTIDNSEVEKLTSKLKKGKDFNLEDFRAQLQQMQKMGGIGELLDKLPGVDQITDQMKSQVNDKQMRRLEAIICSMTPQERCFPSIINGSRRKRIAAGSGTQVQDVNRLLKQFTQMQQMMKKMSKGGLGKMLRGLKGRLPGGMSFKP